MAALYHSMIKIRDNHQTRRRC